MSEIAEEVFATAYHMAIQEKNAMVIISAIERASKIVFALKSYAHTVNSETISAIEICGSIDLVLTLYRNQLKYGIELVRDYTTEAIVNCYPDELNQVWTNIIHNAIHAMNGTGRLVVGVRVVDEQVVVSFSDTGRGIPDDIKPRVFEPFFTTKKAGEGTGMGLSIVKKIVEKHKGTIDFESSEGTGTIFYVHLPRDTNQGN
jgi:signal transduction histidine kinase